jgi:hypothetical protein
MILENILMSFLFTIFSNLETVKKETKVIDITIANAAMPTI